MAIGRKTVSAVGILIDHKTVSGIYAMVTVRGRSVLLADLGSKNGTYEVKRRA